MVWQDGKVDGFGRSHGGRSQDIILRVKSGKASGPFSISVSLLKSLNSIIAKPLEILYNLSFSSGTVPDSFKMARAIPVYKSGSSSSLSNYRPISLLSIFNQTR